MSGLPGKVLLVTFAMAAAAGTATWQLRSRIDTVTPPAANPSPAPAASGSPQEAPRPVTGELQTPEAAGIPAADCLVYPDGTRLPPLNGVKKAPTLQFHRLVPFAKVVRKEFDKATGLEWYVHENGVRSTTHLQWRDGVQEAVAELSMPAKTMPVAEEK